MELTKEEGKSRSHKQAFPEMDLSEWGITSDDSGKRPHQQAFKPKEFPPRICYNCRQPRHYANKCLNPRWNKPHPQRQGSKANKSHHNKKPNIQVKQGRRNFKGIVSTQEHLSL
jgi:hypothetical protein